MEWSQETCLSRGTHSPEFQGQLTTTPVPRAGFQRVNARIADQENLLEKNQNHAKYNNKTMESLINCFEYICTKLKF